MNFLPLLKRGMLCLAILPYSVYSQNIKSDTSFLTNAIQRAQKIYSKATAGEGPLFNGVQYKPLVIHNYDEGHPYFLSDDWIDGTIKYDGGSYDNVAIQYDLIRDKVIIDHPISHFKMELISEKIESFNLNGHTIVRLWADSTKTSIKSGFYDLLYDGKIKVYEKHKKSKREIFQSNVIKSIYDEKSHYYIWMNNTYYPINNKSSMLKVFYNKKTMLKKYLSKSNINFRKTTGLAIAKSAEFYEKSE